MNLYRIMSFLSRLDAMTDNAKTKWHILKFQPWNSAPDVFFWQKLSSLKLEFQLDDQVQCVCSILDLRRLGLAPMSAATAVEPLGALLHAPEGKCVGATKPENASAPIQFVPHQVRGFLNAFEKGPKVLSAYVADGFDLLARACNCKTYLDELTVLSELVDDADARMVEVEDSDEDGMLV
ncbi:hypothetical protein PsorP6_005649 [Peronosclerospora sorghi]|uniref:Uncharacterized protein n=1 Tax=Peronosclerospora sorghi TaxID=230839 RepID=A0ACC0W241_9STRA|nr:hypothetical protein PsorP6_005649 [Peronosclerospora sorghi]